MKQGLFVFKEVEFKMMMFELRFARSVVKMKTLLNASLDWLLMVKAVVAIGDF